MRTQDITATLRSLDAAPQFADTDRVRVVERRARSWDRIQRLIAIEGPAQPLSRPRRRTPRRIGVIVGAVIAAVAVAVAVPSVAGGGDRAFASWTRVPRPLTVQQRDAAASDCRSALAGGAGADDKTDLQRSRTVIAERRGVWTTVLLAGAGGFSALCVTDDSAHLFDKAMIGSVGTPTGQKPTGSRDLTATDLGVGTIRGKSASLAAGTAGDDVVAVTYDSAVRGAVTATVSDGHFAFWLPGDELRSAATSGVTVELRYRDGSTGSSRLRL
ncbi:hypothetical protein GCM10011575_32170 [Microlunatus endophyticus]|uniref:Uncharacterized protein n=1 Tax=Microlunatus endophyticus TaxID=1716077 RepID=A0A917SD25_9ACTN|nr:hypothetical protein [Microlunatus endophyticus]GGL71361.1 hypothetical protein GCM10011575_32170 [Microlunatus endophyticus]